MEPRHDFGRRENETRNDLTPAPPPENHGKSTCTLADPRHIERLPTGDSLRPTTQPYRKPSAHPTMSQHPSLKSSRTVGAKRNVLKRFERIKALKADGRYKKGQSPLGLPKTKPEA